MKFFRICISAAALMIAMYFCLSPSAVAFDYTGAAWCCDNITYCVNPTEPDTTCLPSTGVSDRSFVDVVNAAAMTWNAEGTAFKLVFGGTTNNTGCDFDAGSGNCAGKLDGKSVVSLATTCPLPAGVLATSWWWWSSTPNPCCIFEADICISNDVSWYEDSDPNGCGPGVNLCYDLESVLLHEFGHWGSLGHENDDVLLGYKPSMFWSFNYCEMRRTVTADDAAGLAYIYDATSVIADNLRCDPLHSHPAYAGSPKVPMSGQCNLTPCTGGNCPPGQPFCDSVTTDPCLVVCPASDIVWTVTVKDSCGNAICDMTGTYLDFSNCPAVPCPGEEPDWPLVYPDSCNPVTGVHYFTVDASWPDPAFGCDCSVALYVNGVACRTIPVKFLDLDGDFCVTPADWVGQAPCNDYDCDGSITAADQGFFNSHMDHCCSAPPCPPGPPFCDSVTTDPCLVICPLSDIVWTVTVKDSCGNPICDLTGTYLDFSNCEAQPCPDEEPFWPRVYPDSCNPNTGVHYFTVDASLLGCVDCQAGLFVGGQFCRWIPAKFLDTNGDLCVKQDDWVPAIPCNDYDCDGAVGSLGDQTVFAAHLGHCCPPPCPPGPPLCDSITTDPCLVICPASDIVWTATLKDSCGNPICDPTLALDFSGCTAEPCPGEEPNWPLVFPDSCNPLTGTHYFTVDASLFSAANPCPDCMVNLMLGGVVCRTIPARFLDINGDFCVTPIDWLGQWPCNDYDCNGVIDVFDQNFFNTHMDHCCTAPCPSGQPFCDSVTTDPCLLVCPASDIIWTATIKDSCGNPICDSAGTWLDFSNCTASKPCPGEEPNWPRVLPDSCNPATGVHYFTVDAGLSGCADCPVDLYVDSAFCRTIPAKFLDLTGDLCVDKNDWIPGSTCNDYDCNGIIDAADSVIHSNHVGHCCGTPGGSIHGTKFHDTNCNGIWDTNELPLSGWTINLIQSSTIIATTITDANGEYWFQNLCAGTYWVTEIVQAGWVQTFPPTVLYKVDLLCNQIKDSLNFGNDEDDCTGLSSTSFQLDGTADNYVGSEASSPGTDLLPLLNCGLGMVNFFDSTITNKCFGHTFSNFWNKDCCITGAQLCLRVKATGVIPNTDAISFAENGQVVWSLSMNDLQSFATGGSDVKWSVGDTMNICLDLENLPAWPATGVTNVLAALKDGDFDVKFQDDTEVDWLELRVTQCCPGCCNHDGIRGDINYDMSLDISDLTFLVAYLFQSGPTPPCFEEADVNGDGTLDISDLTYLVAYLFQGGPAPAKC